MFRTSQPASDSHAAFVLGLGTNGYGIVRALGSRGVEVRGVYRSNNEAGRFSRYCRPYYLGPEVQDDEALRNKLIAWATALPAKPTLFVTGDEYAAFLARNSDILADDFSFHWLPWSILEQVVDKSKISLVCERAGVVAPRTHFVSQGDDLTRILPEFRFPCIVKPIQRFGLEGGPKWRARVIDSLHGLTELYQHDLGLWGTSIVQEMIEGEDDEVYQCSVLVTRSGSVGATCSVRKLYQYLPGLGHMCLGRTEENEELIRRSIRVIENLQYRGLASLEFKRRRQDGEYYFIEMNPRLPWYNSLLPEAGVNLAHLAYLDLTMPAGLAHVPAVQRNGVHWLRLEDSVRWLWIRRRQGRARVRSWLRAIARARSFAWWDSRDPLPCLREMAYRYVRYSRRIPGRVLLQSGQQRSAEPS